MWGPSISLRLALKIPDTLVRNEEGPQRSVAVIGDEPAAAPVELSSAAIGAPRLEHILSGARVPKLLRIAQILFLSDGAELAPVLCEVFFEQMLRAKSAPARKGEEGEHADEEKRLTASQ